MQFDAGTFMHRPKFSGLMYDFIDKADLAAFTQTAVNSGTVAQVSTNNGVVRLSGAATTNNSGMLLIAPAVHWNTAPNTNSTTGVTDKAQFELIGSFKRSSTNPGLIFGLTNVGSDLLGTPPTDGIWLSVAQGATRLKLNYARGSSTVTIDLGFDFDSSSHTLGLQCQADVLDGAGHIQVFVDGSTVYNSDNQVSAPITTGLPAQATNLALAIQAESSSNVGTQYIDCDFIRARFSRGAW